MNIKKALLLAGAALSLIALSGPASASAEGVFTHEGSPITEPVEVGFSGPIAINLTEESSSGVHCAESHIAIDLESQGEATVTDFEGTNCTTTNASPSLNGLHVDVHHINVNKWDPMPVPNTSLILVTNTHITNTVTHPVTTHLVIAENTFKGTNVIEIPPNETTEVKTVTLSDEEGVVEPGGDAEVSGHLELVGETQVGIAET